MGIMNIEILTLEFIEYLSNYAYHASEAPLNL